MRRRLKRRIMALCLAAALLAQGAAGFAEAAGRPAQVLAPAAVGEADAPAAADMVEPAAEAGEQAPQPLPGAQIAEDAEEGISPETAALLEKVERQRLDSEADHAYDQRDLFATAPTKKGFQGAADTSAIYYYSRHTLFNIVVSDLIADTPQTGWYAWDYNGKTYWYNLTQIEAEMNRAAVLRSQGMSVSWVLLVRWNDLNANFLIEAGSRVPGYQYYAPDPAAIGAFTAFIAWRCLWWDTAIDNYILGNEANNPNVWHFSGTADPAVVVSKYADAFAQVYTAVRAYTHTSRVSVSLDHYWNHSTPQGLFGSRTFLDLFHAEMERRVPGANWAVSFHLYPPEMSNTDLWNYMHWTPNDPNATMIDGMNLNVLTDYIVSHFGAEHRVLLTEQGFNAVKGDLYQAAGLAISYYAAQYNPQVDCFLLNGATSADPMYHFALDGRMADEVYTKIDNGSAADQAWIEGIIRQASGLPVQSIVPNYGVEQKPVDREQVTAFVTRLYETCLGRAPDAGGLATWVDGLASRTYNGTQAAQGFVFSTEFKNRNYCNEDYVKQLYRAFMGREADASGLATWVGLLESGTTREEVFNGFAGSNEFTNLCGQYGITRGDGLPVPAPGMGTIPGGPCSACGREAGVTLFIRRLYETCMGREADESGLATWTDALVNHTHTGRQVAWGFVFSKEFTNAGYSDEAYVKQLYRAFMGREADESGLAMWVGLLESGTGREEVFNGFAGSTEFARICAQYGIARG